MPLGNGYSQELEERRIFEERRMQVLREGARLFALTSFEGVSMNEIARAVGIKAPSLYNHYTNKDQILQAIFETCSVWMEEYYKRFQEEDIKAQSVEESMENMFVEVREVVDLFPFQALALAQRHAGCNRFAYKLFYEDFYESGLASVRRCLERGQAKGYVPQGLHIDQIAVLMMDFVTHSNVYWLLVNEAEFKMRHDAAWFHAMRQYFVDLIKAGI